jgi:hypothetical protein
MTKVYIHCGLHKTATTSIQKNSFKIRKFLKKKHILYPKPSRRDYNHNSLVDLCAYSESTDWIERIAKRSFRCHGKNGSIFLSAENLEYSFHKETPLLIEQKFAQLGISDITWILVLRNPFDYYNSLYSQLSTGGNPSRPYLDYVATAELAVKWGYLEFLTHSQHQRFIFDYNTLIKSLQARLAGKIVKFTFQEIILSAFPGDQIMRIVSGGRFGFSDLINSLGIDGCHEQVNENQRRSITAIEESYVKRSLALAKYEPPHISTKTLQHELEEVDIQRIRDYRVARRVATEPAVRDLFAKSFPAG